MDNKIKILRAIFRKIACAGNVLTSSNLPAPKYCEIIAEMALLVCPKTQMSIDKKEPTIPAAARDSSPSTGMFPTIAVSVMESRGSAIPATVAGMARLLIRFKVTVDFKMVLYYKFITMEGVGTLIWKVNILQFRIPPCLIKPLVSAVLAKCVQSNRNKTILLGKVFCKVH